MNHKPNIVVVVADALRAQNLSLYGYRKTTSPFLDKISGEGVVFENFYSTTDQTDPSFTTIFSGRHPLVHGITRHGPDITDGNLRVYRGTNTATLARILSSEGYMTLALDWLGRWHKDGYRLYSEPLELSCPLAGKAGRMAASIRARLLSRIQFPGLYRALASTLRCGSDAFSYFRDALKLISKAEKPFFLSLHLWDTHTPLNNVPRAYLKEFYGGECGETVESMASRIASRAWRHLVLNYHLKGVRCVDEIEPRYNAAIRTVDEALNYFYQALADLKLAESTLLVFTADHGDNLVRNGVFIGHGGLYQRVVRVPLVLVGYGVDTRVKTRMLAQHVDLVPTLLGIAGVLRKLRKTYYMDGRDLLAVLRGEEKHREAVVAVSSTAKERLMIIDGRYKYVWSPSPADAMDKFGGIWFTDVEELYDLSRDQDDQENLAGSMPDIVKEMKSKLLEWRKKLLRARVRLLLRASISQL